MAQIRTRKRPKVAQEQWFKTYWRPAMAWLYMALIFYDFMLMPILWPIIHTLLKVSYVAWVPLSLSQGGFLHITFGAVLGLYTWGRTQEVKADPQNAAQRYFEAPEAPESDDDSEEDEPKEKAPKKKTTSEPKSSEEESN